jgi:hypothetical protein
MKKSSAELKEALKIGTGNAITSTTKQMALYGDPLVRFCFHLKLSMLLISFILLAWENCR